ncbi:MAG TPA: M14 family zinc carboxypeptidase [Aquabacterium sp.]|uniref:M14 family zinc carboxypeptidase n=1 Tax=Aquabacterium sp. TaxID=1872578 RepID=UPI002E35F915|nr:M14 family zinc carboxypeptidase [Aquabacterium sp.]HEX5371732.1 M14 family zinc carboxypeptidase [Aquabacterium sp.]
MRTYRLPELEDLPRLITEGGPHLSARTACQIEVGAHRFDVPVITLGNPAPDVPAVGFFGGIHGLERIGAEVVMSYLHSLVQRLKWDRLLHTQLEGLRMVFMPLVNPGGLWLGTRANPQGVDLMRNAPVDAVEPVPFLVGGQRWSAALPWYRGPLGAPMQLESAALCQVVEQELLGRPFSLALDCHSGFGVQDRIWFPLAHTRAPMPHLSEVFALHTIFEQTHAHHRYVFEPQSLQYLAHGDLWDHLYLQAQQQHPEQVFLPLTLEMGSWLWVKKNPRQLFSRHGIFNPLIEHRQQRVLRRHAGLLDFMARASSSHALWRPAEQTRLAQHAQALNHWYGRELSRPASENPA